MSITSDNIGHLKPLIIMANAEFFKGLLGNITGTLSKKTIHTKDGTITRRVIAQVRNGKQRVYFRDFKPRAKEPSQAELHAREIFAKRQEYVQTLIAQGKTRAEAWQIAKQSIQ